MKKLTKMMMLLSVVMIIFSACSKNDEQSGSTGKAKIDNLVMTPTGNLTYGDAITLTANLSDDVGLSTYTITVSNASGSIYDKTQMLTGKAFNLTESVVIPLYPNAVAGDLTLSLTVKNSGGELTSQDLTIKNVQLPTFQKLYLVLNGTIYDMVKNGSVFTFENFVPAGATGKIYANADKTGTFWGSDDGTNVKILGTNDINFGKDDEEYFQISFDPVSFKLTLGDPEQWNPMSGNDLYILGTISGNWRDGEITVEQNKMKMTATSLGNRKRWTWSPPNPEGVGDYDGCQEFTMYGNTVAGVFRLKKAGQEQYVLYSGGNIMTSADNKDNSFVLSAAGQFNIQVMADETGIISVKAYDDNQQRSVEYQNNSKILINGVVAEPSISFAGNALNIVPGNYFVYQGMFDLTNGESVIGTGVDISTLFCDPDVFTGGGNSTWKVIAPTSTYYVRIDAFSGLVYVRDAIGYPNAIYMDGWCWQKYSGDPRSNWNTGTELTLYRVGTSSIYQASCYVHSWGGDIKFFAQPSTTDNLSPGGVISGQYFNLAAGQALMSDNIGLMLPVPDNDGVYYTVSVDLKDGMTQDDDGNYVPLGAKFTYSFTLQQ